MVHLSTTFFFINHHSISVIQHFFVKMYGNETEQRVKWIHSHSLTHSLTYQLIIFSINSCDMPIMRHFIKYSIGMILDMTDIGMEKNSYQKIWLGKFSLENLVIKHAINISNVSFLVDAFN